MLTGIPSRSGRRSGPSDAGTRGVEFIGQSRPACRILSRGIPGQEMFHADLELFIIGIPLRARARLVIRIACLVNAAGAKSYPSVSLGENRPLAPTVLGQKNTVKIHRPECAPIQGLHGVCDFASGESKNLPPIWRLTMIFRIILRTSHATNVFRVKTSVGG